MLLHHDSIEWKSRKFSVSVDQILPNNLAEDCRKSMELITSITSFYRLITYNLGHNILELYNVLVQIRFTTNKTKCDI